MASWLYLKPRTHEQWIAPVGASEAQIAVFDFAGPHTRSCATLDGNTLDSILFGLLGADGDALVIDGDRGVLYWLALNGHDIATDFPVEGSVSDALMLSNGMLLLSTEIPSGPLSGVPLHVVDSAGKRRHSFWAHATEERLSGQRIGGRRVLFPSRPHAMLKSIQVDDQKHLWLMFQVPDASWRPLAPITPDADRGSHHHGGHGAGGRHVDAVHAPIGLVAGRTRSASVRSRAVMS